MLPDFNASGVLLDSLKFLPELLLCTGIVVLLALRLVPALDRLHLGGTALLFVLLALGVSACQWLNLYGGPQPDGRAGETLSNAYRGLGLSALQPPGRYEVRFFGNLLVYDT